MVSASFKLSDGSEIQVLLWGNGTQQAKYRTLEAGKWAIEAGLGIDTAFGYNNEAETGELVTGLNSVGKVHVTTKLSQKNGSTTDIPIKVSEVRAAVAQSIASLGFQPDLLLVHNPFVPEAGSLVAFWKVLEDMKDSGELTSSIGVSNFRPQDFAALLPVCKYKPVVNQVEFHPFMLSHLEPVLKIHAEHGIVTEAYGPLTPILRHPNKSNRLIPILNRIASRLQTATGIEEIDNATVLLIWTRAMGVVAVTSSVNQERIKKLGESLNYGGMLTEAEVEEITETGKQVHFSHYSEHMCVDYPAPNLPSE